MYIFHPLLLLEAPLLTRSQRGKSTPNHKEVDI